MICAAWNSKKILSEKCCLVFCAFDFEAIPPPNCYLTSIMDKTHHGSVIALFPVQLQQPFSYTGGIVVTNHFPLLLTDRYILAIQQIITHKEHLQYSFWSVAIFGRVSEALRPWSQQQKLANTTSESLSLSNSSQKSPFFAVLMYTLYGHPRYFKFKWKYQQYGPCFQTIFPFPMTMHKLHLTTILKKTVFWPSILLHIIKNKKERNEKRMLIVEN